MDRRWIRFNLTIALGLSLIVHGGLVWWMVRDQVEQMIAFLLAGTPPVVQAQTAPPATRIEPPKPEDMIDIDTELGEWHGTGTAIAAVEGDQPLAGRKANQDQPLLSRDPVGHGKVGDAPTQYAGRTGKGGEALEQLRESVAAQDPGQTTMAMKFAQESPEIVAPRPKPTGGPSTAPAAQPEAGPTVVASSGGAQPTPPQKSGDAPDKSADPAPMSDSEIDLFSKVSVVEFRQGKAAPQFGRKAKLTRPHIPLAGAIDAFGMGRSVRVELVLKTDEKGQVINARVAKGSGSNEIDNPVRREAYNWSFDPGEPDHPLPREFPLVVAIYD